MASFGRPLRKALLFSVFALSVLASASAQSSTDHHIALDPHIGNTKSHRKVIDYTDGTHHELQPPAPDDGLEHHDFMSMVYELSFTDAFISSISMIIVSEIGDETFLIAAIMSMRHPKSVVFSGALSALVIMTVLSTGLGLVVPKLITKRTTARCAAVLYTFFGLRLMYIGMRADPKEKMDAEFEEVEEKLQDAGSGIPKSRIRRFFSRFCTPIFLESFVLTFLAEWGDRSQITTIALASHKNPIGITVGASIGHALCTGLAVQSGTMLAAKISQRTVAFSGGILFIIFAAHSYWTSQHT